MIGRQGKGRMMKTLYAVLLLHLCGSVTQAGGISSWTGALPQVRLRSGANNEADDVLFQTSRGRLVFAREMDTSHVSQIKTEDSNERPGAGNTWYVRPAGRRYGKEDGTSYEDAWNGLLGVVWGDHGVKAGDTLYVCGLHLHVMERRDPPIYTAIYPATGLTGRQTVTIRGDYPTDPGIIWGAAGLMYEDWRYEGDSLWSIGLPGQCYVDWFFQDITAQTWIVLAKEDDIAGARGQPGSFYYGGQRDDRLYVHLTDSGNPTGRIYVNSFGYWFNVDRTRYITFKHLKLYNVDRFCRDSWDVGHIEWNDCVFLYGHYFLLRFYDHQHSMRIIDCEIGWAGNGIYIVSTTNDAPKNFVIRGNYIHDIGVRAANQNGDAHAIGAQGWCNTLVEDNVCENIGTGISFYAFTDQEARNNTIRRNRIVNTHTLGGANSRGIETMCNNDSLSDKSRNRFYQNIVRNADIGYRFTHEDEQEIYNNIAYQCNTGFVFIRSYAGYGPFVKLRNNIVYGSRQRHMLYLSGSSASTMVDSDYNLFFPDGPTLFKCNGQEGSFAQWQAFTVRDFNYDPHSRVADPCFVDPEHGDFHLRPDSPCIDGGTDVGLGRDREGIRIPSGLQIDIGPYEYPLVTSPVTSGRLWGTDAAGP